MLIINKYNRKDKYEALYGFPYSHSDCDGWGYWFPYPHSDRDEWGYGFPYSRSDCDEWGYEFPYSRSYFDGWRYGLYLFKIQVMEKLFIFQ